MRTRRFVRARITATSAAPGQASSSARARGGRCLVRRGAAAAELAVVLPVFILLLMGLLEFGRMIMVQQVLTNASREGARRASLEGATVIDVESTVSTFLANASVSGATVATTPTSLASAAPGSQVSVSVSVPFNQVSWLPPWFSSGVTLSANSLMRREGIP